MKNKNCVFHMIYTYRPDMLINGLSIAKFRIQLGERLAKESFCKADIVSAIPESGYFPAIGYANKLNIPFNFGVIKDYDAPRTLALIENTLKRQESLIKKLIVLPEILQEKNIILIDESMISGGTINVIIKKLHKIKIKSIHIRISSPIMINYCPFGVLSNKINLIGKQLLKKGSEILIVEKNIQDYFGVDSLKFLSLGGFLNELELIDNYCIDCFK